MQWGASKVLSRLTRPTVLFRLMHTHRITVVHRTVSLWLRRERASDELIHRVVVADEAGMWDTIEAWQSQYRIRTRDVRHM